MSDDLRAMLHDAAHEPVGPSPDADAIHARRVRRTVAARTAGTLALIAVIGLGTTLIDASTPEPAPIIDTPTESPTPSPTATPTASATEASRVGTVVAWPDGPSQREQDAARDGVVPALAALPLAERIEAVAGAHTSDGMWVLSRPPCADPGCVVGDATGVEGNDWQTLDGYAELLLLDPDSLELLRAWPMPLGARSEGPKIESLEATSDAVFAFVTGEQAWAIVRVDRQSLDEQVRLFAPPWTALPADPGAEQPVPEALTSRLGWSAAIVADPVPNLGIVVGDTHVAGLRSAGADARDMATRLYDAETLAHRDVLSIFGHHRGTGPFGTVTDEYLSFVDPRLSVDSADTTAFADALRQTLPEQRRRNISSDWVEAGPDVTVGWIGSDDGATIAVWERSVGSWVTAPLGGSGDPYRSDFAVTADGDVLIHHDGLLRRIELDTAEQTIIGELPDDDEQRGLVVVDGPAPDSYRVLRGRTVHDIVGL